MIFLFLGGNNGTICGPEEENCIAKANGKLSLKHFP
jgi:hypothetical protein